MEVEVARTVLVPLLTERARRRGAEYSAWAPEAAGVGEEPRLGKEAGLAEAAGVEVAEEAVPQEEAPEQDREEEREPAASRQAAKQESLPLVIRITKGKSHNQGKKKEALGRGV